MSGKAPVPVHVTGGVGGIVANREAILALSAVYRSTVGPLALMEIELGVLRSDVGDVYDAVGLSFASPAFGAVIAAAEAVGRAQHSVVRAREHTLRLSANLEYAAHGYPWNVTLDQIVGPSLWDEVSDAVDGAWEFGRDVVDHGTTGTQKFLVDHPGTVDDVVNHGETVLAFTPAGLLVGDLEAYRAVVESLDGDGRAIAIGTEGVRAPPRSLADLAAELARRDTGPGGSIDVQIITGADGSRHVVVDVTGIDTALPVPPGRDVADLATCARAIDGKSTAYEQGVFDAMRQAGVRPGDPVLIIGHSLGGMIAVNAARTAARTGEFTVTHVVTEGSPVGRTVGRLPASVQVLAIENTHDVVPHLDGRANPDRRNVTTVTGTAGDDLTIAGDHDSRTVYVPLAAATDASGNASVRAFLGSASGFLSGTSVTTRTFTVVRS